MSAERPRLVAPVAGAAAAALVVVLDARLAVLATLAARGRISSGDLAEAREVFAAIREAASEWVARASPERSNETVLSAAPADCSEIDSAEAAGLLNVSPRRVQQLLAAGELEGRRSGRVWLVSRASVLLWRDTRRGVAA